MFSNQSRRLIGSGFDTDAVPDINKFRTKEIMEEDNVYNRRVLELEKKKVMSLSIQAEVTKPLTEMTEQEKYQLNLHINRFLNEIDNEIGAYYNNVLHYNTGKLINYWNVLCIYYKVNVLKTYKPLLDSQIVGEPTEKVRVIRNVAIDSDYIDKNEISTLYNYMVATNYEPIRYILYSSNRNNVGELTPYEETLLDPSDPRHRQVIRSRNIPLGRPQKIPQSVKVSIDPVTGKQVRTMPKRTYTKKNKKTDTETETEEEQQPYEIDMSEDPALPAPAPASASASATPKKPIKLKTQKP